MNLQQLVEAKEAIESEYSKLVSEAETAKRSFSAEEKEKAKSWGAELKELQDKIDTKELSDSFKSQVETVRSSKAVEVSNYSCKRDLTPSDANTLTRNFVLDKLPAEWRDERVNRSLADAQALGSKHDFNIKRNNFTYCMPIQDGGITRSITSETTNKGAELVSIGFSNTMVEYLKYYFAGYNAFTVFNTENGDDWKEPNIDTTAVTLAKRTNNTTALSATSSDSIFANIVFKAYPYVSEIWKVVADTVKDSRYNINDVMAKVFGSAYGRSLQSTIFAAASANTNGTAGPMSVFYGVGSSLNMANTNILTSALLDSAIDQVDHAYVSQPGMGIFMNKLQWSKVCQEVDGEDRPVWRHDLGSAIAPVFRGIPVYFVPSLPAPGVGSDYDNLPAVLVGNTSYFKIRNAGDAFIRQSDQIYWTTQEIGFMDGRRYDHRWSIAPAGNTSNAVAVTINTYNA